MRNELDIKLNEDFKDIMTGPFGLGVPISCGDGWYELIRDTLVLLSNQAKKEKFDLHIWDVKEKFGGIRIYIAIGSKEIYDIINKTESKSYTICEKCGKPGILRKYGGWYSTACDDCGTGKGWVIVKNQ